MLALALIFALTLVLAMIPALALALVNWQPLRHCQSDRQPTFREMAWMASS
jgi:hypothetical protein